VPRKDLVYVSELDSQQTLCLKHPSKWGKFLPIVHRPLCRRKQIWFQKIYVWKTQDEIVLS